MLPHGRRCGASLIVTLAIAGAGPLAGSGPRAVAPRPVAQSAGPSLDREAERWVEDTLGRMSLEEKVGQLIVPGLYATFVSTDSEVFDALSRLVREYHVGGFHLFGARQPAPRVLLNPSYGTVLLGQPLEAASLLNRLQAMARAPLLVSADFETGVGFRIQGATTFPRAMAFGAASTDREVYEAGRMTAVEARALGVHVNAAPVADVNNNPRNSVINTRSYGEDPVRVAALSAAYVRGAQAGGLIATVKHFPGHGDTDVDTHLGLARITHARERLAQVEWQPFVRAIEAGVGAVMTSHIELPAIDPAPETPTTFSRPIVSGVLREELGFGGLVYTDSMSMRAVSDLVSPGEAAVRAIQAGHDLVLDPPDPIAAIEGIKAALARGAVTAEQVDRSVERLLRAKAGLGLHRERLVSLEALPERIGTRAHLALAEQISQQAITLVKDAGRLAASSGAGAIPLAVPRDARLLYLSVLDYPSGWAIAAPSRTFIPELQDRWPNVTAVELSDRSSASEIELVQSTVPRYDAVVASVFVRTASYSGRMDLAPALVALLERVEAVTAAAGIPFVTVFFGNPYVATALPGLSTMLLTYDFSDLAERSAVRALAGEAPIGGRLPISLPGVAPAGAGLVRPGP